MIHNADKPVARDNSTYTRLIPGRIIGLIILLLSLSACGMDAGASMESGDVSVGELSIGMSEQAFLSMYPGAREEGIGRYARTSREFGISGKWIYAFHDGVLSWYIFNAHQTEISEESFKRTYQAAGEIIDRYTGRYGTPWREDRGYSEYINPMNQAHNGYKVREAQWRTPHGQVVVDFSFLGEGGVYSLLLTIQATS
jgi:hypothetical protein